MSSLLDILGATIAGTVVLIMIFSALFNIQVISHNTQLQISLSQMSEDLITGRKIGTTYYLGLESILSKVGAGVPEATDPIIEATSNSFKFLGRSNPSSAISTFYFIQESETSDGFPLYFYQDDMSNHISGPFWMADSLAILYYDQSNNLISSPNSNHSDIRSIKVELPFFYNTYRSDIDKKFIKHNVVFWKYFKNLYL